MKKKIGILCMVLLLALGASALAAEEALTLEGAKAIALEEAKLTKDAVVVIKLKEDIDDGRREFEVAFIAGGLEYEFDIDAETGDVIKRSSERADMAWNAIGDAKYMTLEDAKEKALAHAGVAAEDALFQEIQLDYDDARLLYEIELVAGDTVYEIDMDAQTGDLVKLETETVRG